LREEAGAAGPHVRDTDAEQNGGDEPDRAEIEGGGAAEHEAPQPGREARAVLDVGLEIAPPRSDQVIAHVRGAVRGPAPLAGLARAFHGAQRDTDLGFARRFGQLFHRVAVAIAAEEVHAAVHARGIAPQHLLDQADALEVLRPVVGATEAQAGDGVGDRDLRGGLALVLGADRILRRHALGGEAFFDGGAHRSHERSVLAHALQQPHDGRGFQDGGQGGQSGGAARFDPGQVSVGLEARVPSADGFFRQAPEILDEGELEGAGPGPQLADGEGRYGLERRHEAQQLLAFEATVGVCDQLQRHGVDAGDAGPLA